MFRQLRKIIRENEKVEIIHKGVSFCVKKQDLYSKIEILCRNQENNTELYLILGSVLAVKAIKLEKGIIYSYFKKENFDEDKPEVKIERQSNLYELLKGMRNFD